MKIISLRFYAQPIGWVCLGGGKVGLSYGFVGGGPLFGIFWIEFGL